MKVSVSSYSFSQYIRAGKMTQFDTVAKAKEMGFDSTQIYKDLAEQLRVVKIIQN